METANTVIKAQPEAQRIGVPNETAPAPETGAIPLSFAQQRLWFLDQLAPNSPMYNVPTVAEVQGQLDIRALEGALDQLARRHEILRTRFMSSDGSPAQVVELTPALRLSLRDLTGLPAADRERQARREVRAEVNRPFHLGTAPLARALLLRIEPDRHWFVLNLHHIISDEWSLGICFRELGEFYAAALEGRPPALPELPIQYGDYAVWQRDSLEQNGFERDLAYWQRQLDANPPPLALPADRPRPRSPAFQGGTVSRALPAAFAGALKRFAAAHEATPFMVLLAAFEALLHRYTRQDDIIIGSPIAGRNQLETEPLIGFFVNTLMIRVNLSGDPPFTELLGRVREVMLGAYAHAELPFEKLVERLHPERTLDHMPFTGIMFAVQHALTQTAGWTGLTLRFLEVESDTAKFDLTFVAQESGDGLLARAEYDRALFDAGTIERLLERFETLLGGLLADPHRRLSELPLLPAAEQQLLLEWNRTTTDYPRDRAIPALFEAQVRRSPDAVAAVFGESVVTYRELNERANQLAHGLRRLGIRPGVLAGLCVSRSIDMLVGMAAILKAGGAYVPLDPTYPRERLAGMVEDAEVSVLLTQQRLLDRVPPTVPRIVCLDADWDSVAHEERTNLPEACGGGDAAYVMYTSGSTGRPKGVVVPHRGILRLVLNTNYLAIRTEDRVAQVSNASFDAATFEIWGALLNGARVVGITKEAALSPDEFARELRQQEISVLFLTTALFNEMADEAPGAFAGVRALLFGGEAVDPKRVRAVLDCRPPKRLLHVYGPTENTTFSSWYEVRAVPESAHTVPIGGPVSNTVFQVLDQRLKPVPVGVPGELCLGGDGLAIGYWRRPELNAEKFIDLSLREGEPGQRLYRTGDLVRWLPDGNLEFLGRIDQQVKIRGFRVEPAEIEGALNRCPGVRESVVVLRPNPVGGNRLVAYFTSTGKREPSTSELLRFLHQNLPDYMVPAVFVPLNAIPLTPNGKVDRAALPAPDQSRPRLEKSYATPRDAIELKLRDIWEEVLGIHPIGIEDKFFELGGHSLLAVRLIARIEKAFGRRLRLATIFQAQTIVQLAAIMREERQEGGANGGTSVVDIQPHGRRPPLFFVHGVGGGMFWGYANLSRHLGTDQPVYALKSRGLDGHDEWTSIEDMAAQYVADVRAMQPRGPYYLGGYCFGGNVAYEMARQLCAQGEQVALLAVFNCAPANSSYQRVSCSLTWLARFARNFVYWIGCVRLWTPRQRRDFFRWKTALMKRRLRRCLRRSNGAIPDPGDMVDLSSFSAEQRRLWETHLRSLASYHPQPFPGKVHLFRSPGHQWLCSFESDYGWSTYAKTGVHTVIVPGVHERILEEPCVSILATELNKILVQLPAQPPQPPGATAARPANADRSATSENAAAALDYWTRQLAGAPALLEFPADRPRPLAHEDTRPCENVALSKSATDALETLSRDEACPPFAVLLAVLQSVLCRYTGATDIIVGTLASNVRAAAGHDAAGREENVLALRCDLSGDPEFHEIVARTRAAVLAAAANASAPFQRVLEELRVARHAGVHPVFQVFFEYRDTTGASKDASHRVPNSAGPGTRWNASLPAAAVDLALCLESSDEGLTGRVEYRAGLFDADRIRRFIGHIETLLQGAAKNPGQRLSRLPLLPASEIRLLEEWNNTFRPHDGRATIALLIEQQVTRTPGRPALLAGDERLTYAELNGRANQLAHYLRSLGVGPGVLVGLCVERSWRLVVGVLGVLKAGGGYVPMDPTYPRDRLAVILADSQASVLITQESTFRPAGGVRIVCLDADWPLVERESRENPFSGVEPSDLAYLIYTSGSTGTPKGVALEHRGVVALLAWAADVYAPAELAGVLASTSICFDLSVFELLVPLTRGGMVILVENALALPGLPEANEVTLVNTVPSAARELLRIKGIPASVRVINLAGEPLASALVDRLYAETRVEKVYDLYGPSETTTYSTCALRRRGEPATIGRPLPNEQVYLLDANRQLVPIGVPGEIYIGGAGLARGYLNRPELTADRFVPHPGKRGSRLYRTGDLARWRADGNLEFIGRLDHQVKIRGFRIELGEVESVLRTHPLVADAVVAAVEDRREHRRLAAYVVLKGRGNEAIEELRRHCAERLPEYMVPPLFIVLPALPLTPNGKVDRRALPRPDAVRDQSSIEFVAPGTPTERELAAIWREVLHLDRVGVRDHLFELGGDSLLAIQIISRIREVFRIELPLFGLFNAPTIEALARGIESGAWQRRDTTLAAPAKAPRDGDIPVSFVQERLWFLDQLEPGNRAYNLPVALRLRGALNRAALSRAFGEIVRRHEALRTTLVYADGNLKQRIGPPAPVAIAVSNLKDGPGNAEERMREWIDREARRPFDLAAGPLLRVHLARLGGRDQVLLVVLHHTIADGWSLTLLFGELEAFYDAYASGAPLAVPPAPALQYADYTVWKRNTMQGTVLERELKFWTETLRGLPASLALPFDHAAPENPERRADRQALRFTRESTEALAALSLRENSTLFVVLLSVLAVVLEKWTRRRDFAIGTVVAGRTRREFENAIGCFMNFLPLRIRISPDETGQALLDQVKHIVLEAQDHQRCPFEKIVEAVNPERQLNQNPLYNVALLLQNYPAQMFRSRTLEVEAVPVDLHAALLDLRFEAEWTGPALSLTCEYRADLFEAATIRHLLQSCRQVLETLVRNPALPVRELAVTPGLEAQANAARNRSREQRLAITATFTAEPIEESLRHWLRELGIAARIEFAPYHQVFQQLLDPASLLGTNTAGLNIVLARLEDWLDSAANAADPGPELQERARELVTSVKSAAGRVAAPILVCFCPPSAGIAEDERRAAGHNAAERFAAAALEAVPGVHVVRAAELLELYPVSGGHGDAHAEEIGRVPYTPVFFTALGTLIARKFHALQRPPCKVIVLDCDHTLWGGVCGEDDPKGLRIEAPWRVLQEFMVRQHAAGRLLALCSKNNEEDVRGVFAQRTDMPLRLEHFAAMRLNWQPKSGNLRSLAAELRLGLESFVFVDDNPVECAEVEANCPEVLALQLPENPADIPRFLDHCWVFDRLKETTEDRRRGEMYQENRRREQWLARAADLADFLTGLELRVQIDPLTPDQLPRAAQLTQRTNQFNLTSVRRTETELRALAETAEVLTVSVRDRFGEYGLVGVVVFAARPDAIEVETMLLSCRVLGRGVEHQVVAHLGRLARERHLPEVRLLFRPSAKNRPAFEFLQASGADPRPQPDGGTVYAFSADTAAGLIFQPPRGTAMPAPTAAPGGPPPAAAPGPPAKFTRCRAIALEANDAAVIHRAIEARAGLRSRRPERSSPPRTDLERQLCGIWERLLRVSNVGVKDNFFELGGHSLLAVRLFAEIEKLTGHKFPLVTIFQVPTVEGLTALLSAGQGARTRSPIVPVRATGSRTPLFLVHGAGGDVLWGYANLANQLHPDQPVYGIKSRGQVGLEEYERIEDMARYYLEEVRAFQPAGPYCLGGYCLGGNIAYEMARQLRALGENVAAVLLIDAFPANAGYERVTWWRRGFGWRFVRNLRYWLEDFSELHFEDRLRFVQRKVRALGRRAAAKLRRGSGPGDVDLEEVIDVNHFPAHELKFWQVHLNALEQHVQQPYEGLVTLIRTRGQPLFCSLEEDFCWSRLARGGVRIRRIPGSHENIFTGTNVKSLADEIEAALAETRDGAQSSASAEMVGAA